MLCSSIFTRAGSLNRSDGSRVPVFGYESVKAYSHQTRLRPSTGVDALGLTVGRPDFTCCVVQSSQEPVASKGVTGRGFQCSAMHQ